MSEKPLRILYHHRTQGRAVEGVHIRELIGALQALGHAVDEVSVPGVTVADGVDRHPQTRSGVRQRLWALLSRTLPEVGFELLEMAYGVYAYQVIGRRLRRGTYHLFYERYAIFNWAGIAQARRWGVPSILEVNYTSASSLSRKRHAWLQRLAHRIDRQLFAQADAIVVVSDRLRRHLVEDFGVAQQKILTLTNAADPRRFNPATVDGHVRETYGIAGRRVVGFIGRFLPWHGLDGLVRAMPLILREAPETMFLFVGDGPQRRRIEAEITRLALGQHTVFIGDVPHAALPEFIKAFDVAVLPSSNDYGSPMKLFEYMAMQRAIVAPRLGPIEEVIGHEQEGLLFEPGEIEPMAAAIIRLFRDEALRHRLGSAARAKVVRVFNWEHHARAVLALTQRLSERSSPC